MYLPSLQGGGLSLALLVPREEAHTAVRALSVNAQSPIPRNPDYDASHADTSALKSTMNVNTIKCPQLQYRFCIRVYISLPVTYTFAHNIKQKF